MHLIKRCSGPVRMVIVGAGAGTVRTRCSRLMWFKELLKEIVSKRGCKRGWGSQAYRRPGEGSTFR